MSKVQTYARTFAKNGSNLLNYILLRLKPVFCTGTPQDPASRESIFPQTRSSGPRDRPLFLGHVCKASHADEMARRGGSGQAQEWQQSPVTSSAPITHVPFRAGEVGVDDSPRCSLPEEAPSFGRAVSRAAPLAQANDCPSQPMTRLESERLAG